MAPAHTVLTAAAAALGYTPEALRSQPDEQDVYCSGCGAKNQGNPCGECRKRPGGA